MQVNWTQLLPRLWLPLAEVLAGLILAPLVRRSILKMARKAPDKGLATFLASLSSVAIITMTVLLALEQLGIRMTGTLSLISAIGLGLTLALKENMSNVAGGIQILLTRPFSVGDYIKVSSHQGTVSSIELMYTTIRTDNGKEVIIPNSVLVQDLITNWSREPLMQMTVHFQVAVPCDLQEALDQARKLTAGCPWLSPDPKIETWCSSVVEGYAKLTVSASVKGRQAEQARRWILTRIATEITAYQPEPKETGSGEKSDPAADAKAVQS